MLYYCQTEKMEGWQGTYKSDLQMHPITLYYETEMEYIIALLTEYVRQQNVKT